MATIIASKGIWTDAAIWYRSSPFCNPYQVKQPVKIVNMRTITIDIINDKVINLLKDLELLKLIRLRRDKPNDELVAHDWTKYKGAMSRQPLNEIDQQLNQLRSEWE